MWIPNKISFLKKNHQKKKEEHITFVLAITSGSENTGGVKLTDNLALDEINDDSHIVRTENNIDGKLYRLRNNKQLIIQVIECTGIPSMKLDSLDGVLICYDLTNKDSMTSLSDMTRTFVAEKVPCLLVGFKSDLTASRTVDARSGYLIGESFGVQAVEFDDFTVRETELLQASFKRLIYSDRKIWTSSTFIQPSSTLNTSATSTVSIPPTPPPKKKLQSMQVASPTHSLPPAKPQPQVQSLPPVPSSSTTSSASSEGESVENIIDHLLNNPQDKDGIIVFLTVFRKFMKPSQLVRILIEKFDLTHQQDDHFKSSNTTEDFLLANSRQQGIRSFLCIWLSTYWNDFSSSDTRRMLLGFLDSISNHQELSPICDVLFPLATRDAPLDDKDACWGMTDEEQVVVPQGKKDSAFCDALQPTSSSSSSSPPLPLKRTTENNASTSKRAASAMPHRKNASNSNEAPLSKGKSTSGSFLLQKHRQQQNREAKNKEPSFHFGGGIIPLHHDHSIVIHDHKAKFEMLMSLTPTKLAEQLTWIDLEIFKKIQPRDFLRQLWSTQDKKSCSSSNPVSASIEHFNFVSGWIASLVVDQALIEKRVRVLEFFWKLAVELKRMNNFNTLMAVMAGVNSAAVLRLKRTRTEVQSKNKELYEQYLELEALMSSGGSFRHYRAALSQTVDVPGIPYLGIHQQDLVSLGQANKDYKANGRVHWKKFQLIGDCIQQVMRFRYPTYTTLEPDSSIMYFIGHKSTVPSEDERYEKSLVIEPKDSPRPTPSNSAFARWLSSKKHV